MRRFFVFAVLLLCSAWLARAGEWDVVKIGGRDYLTMENVAEFYAFGPVQRNGNTFLLHTTGRSLRGEANSVEFLINGLKFNLSYPIAEHDGHLCISRMDLTKLVEPVLRPSRIKNAEKIDTVVLDAGHGGYNGGAASSFGLEKNYTLDVVARARLLLQQQGINVVLTRATDTFISLADRVAIANQYKNALFISVHFNSGGTGTGLETYTLAPRGVPSMMADGPRISDLDPCPGHACDAQNMALATATHAALVVKSQLHDRGIKRARFVVIRDLTIPGVLIEGGFLSNAHDARLIATATYRQTMAGCIAQAVRNYRRAVGAQTADVSGSPAHAPAVAASQGSGQSAAPQVPAMRPGPAF
jgi:N-acetylmuramoyl-L-alanine amidase